MQFPDLLQVSHLVFELARIFSSSFGSSLLGR